MLDLSKKMMHFSKFNLDLRKTKGNQLFTLDNWNYVQYKNDDKKAIISLLSTPSDSDEGHEIYYCITLLDSENNELFQSRFSSLESACQNINVKYGEIWDFMDLSVDSDGGGCGSCSAH